MGLSSGQLIDLTGNYLMLRPGLSTLKINDG